MQVASGGDEQHVVPLDTAFLKIGLPQDCFFSRGIFLKGDISLDYPYSKRVFPKARMLKSASLFDAVAHADAVAQIACEGERWILRLKGSNGCKSLCR